jgi:hypothetical protein
MTCKNKGCVGYCRFQQPTTPTNPKIVVQIQKAA